MADTKGPSGTPAKSPAAKPARAKTSAAKPGAKKTAKSALATKATRSSTRAASQKPVAAMARSVVDKAEADALKTTKKELVARMVRETGMKPGEARKALDATLSVLRGALRDEGEIAAAPLGKIRVTRKKATRNGDLVVCRIKLKDPKPAPDEATE